jgi:hypothetical protein
MTVGFKTAGRASDDEIQLVTQKSFGPVEKVHFAISQRANSSGIIQIAVSKIWTLSTGPFVLRGGRREEFCTSTRPTCPCHQTHEFPARDFCLINAVVFRDVRYWYELMSLNRVAAERSPPQQAKTTKQ